jgi:hypothetical protein
MSAATLLNALKSSYETTWDVLTSMAVLTTLLVATVSGIIAETQPAECLIPKIEYALTCCNKHAKIPLLGIVASGLAASMAIDPVIRHMYFARDFQSFRKSAGAAMTAKEADTDNPGSGSRTLSPAARKLISATISEALPKTKCTVKLLWCLVGYRVVIFGGFIGSLYSLVAELGMGIAFGGGTNATRFKTRYYKFDCPASCMIDTASPSPEAKMLYLGNSTHFLCHRATESPVAFWTLVAALLLYGLGSKSFALFVFAVHKKKTNIEKLLRYAEGDGRSLELRLFLRGFNEMLAIDNEEILREQRIEFTRDLQTAEQTREPLERLINVMGPLTDRLVVWNERLRTTASEGANSIKDQLEAIHTNPTGTSVVPDFTMIELEYRRQNEDLLVLLRYARFQRGKIVDDLIIADFQAHDRPDSNLIKILRAGPDSDFRSVARFQPHGLPGEVITDLFWAPVATFATRRAPTNEPTSEPTTNQHSYAGLRVSVL